MTQPNDIGPDGGSFSIPTSQPSTAPSQGRQIKILTLHEALSIKRPQFLIQGVIPAGALALIFGKTGIYKTFIALSMSCQIAAGKLWYDHPVTPGTVLYIMAEGIVGLRARLVAWDREFLADEAHPLWSRLTIVNQPVQVASNELDGLLEATAKLPKPPALIVIDTLARCSLGADENDTHDMGRFISACDRLREATGATVLVVHHTGWDETRERGSSALGAAVDARFKMELNGDQVVLRCTKQKDAPATPPMYFEVEVVDLGVDEDGLPLSSCRLVPAAAARGSQAHAPRLSGHRRTILSFLITPPSGQPPTVAEIHDGTGIPKASLYRDLRALENKGYVTALPDAAPRRYAVTETGREEGVS
jgi:archaellum biogenesis ATPase FlaH